MNAIAMHLSPKGAMMNLAPAHPLDDDMPRRGWDPTSGTLPLPEDLPETWNGPWVSARLVEAFAILHRMPAGGGGNSAWPFRIIHEFEDIRGYADQYRAEQWAEWGRSRGARPHEVSRMEEAMDWPLKYLQRHPGEARCLLAWAACRGMKRSLSRELRKRKWSRETVRRKRMEAARRIARELDRIGAPVR